jgi:hypothetical protein
MAIEAWPGTLPDPLILSEAAPTSGQVDPDADLYPEPNRRLPDSQVKVDFAMTGAQLATFRTFMDTTLNGAAFFSAGWLAGLGFTGHFAQQAAPYEIDRIPGVGWKVTLTVGVIKT